MRQEEKWKTLADLLIEIQEMGTKIPANVMDDLRSAKTIIQVLKADPTHIESVTRVEVYLKNVEAYAISVAEKMGTKTVQDWLQKLEQSGIEKQEKLRSSVVTPRVPRGKSWIRIENSGDFAPEQVKKLAKESNLSYEMQENGYSLVYGDEKDIKALVKTMAERFRGSRKE